MTLMLCKRSTGRGAHWLSVGIAAGVLRVIPAAQPRPGGLLYHKELRMATSVVPPRVGRSSTPALCSPRHSRAQSPASHREMDPHTLSPAGVVDTGWIKLPGIRKAEFAEHRALRVEVEVQEARGGS